MEILVDSHGFASWTDAAGTPHKARCALGRSGIGDKISEGDGHTPIGRFPLRRVMVRGDRVPAVHTALPVSQLSKADGCAMIRPLPITTSPSPYPIRRAMKSCGGTTPFMT